MGFFEDNAGLFFVAIALLSAISGFFGAQIHAWIVRRGVNVIRN